jgi:hypothetical protein
MIYVHKKLEVPKMPQCTPMVAQDLVLDTEEDILKFTQGIRLTAVKEILSDGKMPDEKDGQNFLAKMLDGMDKQAINVIRAKIEKSNGDNNAAAIEAVAAALKDKALTQIYTSTGIVGTVKSLPELTEVFEALPGEFEVGASSQTCAEFMKRMIPED